MCEIYDKNISNKKCKKLKNCLFGMKRIKLFFSCKRALCFTERVPWTKGGLDNPEGQLRTESPIIGRCS